MHHIEEQFPVKTNAPLPRFALSGLHAHHHFPMLKRDYIGGTGNSHKVPVYLRNFSITHQRDTHLLQPRKNSAMSRGNPETGREGLPCPRSQPRQIQRFSTLPIEDLQRGKCLWSNPLTIPAAHDTIPLSCRATKTRDAVFSELFG